MRTFIPRRDYDKEKTQTYTTQVTSYIASPELAKELTYRAEKAAEELRQSRDRNIALAGSQTKRR